MGKCYFMDTWLIKDSYKQWLQRSSKGNQYAYCKFCRKDFSVTSMGEYALKSHSASAKHVQLNDLDSKSKSNCTPTLKHFFNQNSLSSSLSSSSSLSAASSSQFSTKSAFTGDDVLKAEVLHTLNLIEKHHSYSSSSNSSALYRLMFPDSQIAAGFQCGDRKSAYMSTFGIAPYLERMEMKALQRSQQYVLLFDESLNEHLHMKQLDTHVRYWTGDTVQTHYLTSQFLGHAKAIDLHEHLRQSWEKLPVRSGLLQLSMDGPNVNWAAFKSFSKEVEQETNNKLINIGSCGIHTLHNAFKEGMTKSFNLGSYLSSLHWLFKDSPARREDFTTITGSVVFPLSYCGHRWLENVSCIERALQLLKPMELYIKEVKTKTGYEPSCKSFASTRDFISDPFLQAKLEASLMIARIVGPFLKKFQSDSPMLPFFSSDLFDILIKLLNKILKPDILKTITTPKDLHKIDMLDDKIFLTPHKVDIGTAAKDLLKNIRQSELRILSFRAEFLLFVRTMVKKLLNKSPIKYKLVRCCVFLNPTVMVTDRACSLLSQTLDELREVNKVTAAECDAIKDEFVHFKNHIMNRNVFSTYDCSSERLDSFLHLHLKEQCPRLWTIVNLLLLLSHGQSSVERGFSYNKEISVENLSQVSVIAQRRITEHIKRCGGTIKVPITKELLSAAASGRQNYHQYLEKEKEEKRKQQEKRKLDSGVQEVQDLKKKRQKLMNECNDLTSEADKLASQAEDKGNFMLLSRSNALREKSRSKHQEVASLDIEIQEKLQQLS